MINVMIFIVAYLSLMILVMPTTVMGILRVLILFIAGICFIFWRKPRIKKFIFSWKYIIIVVGMIGYVGIAFFNRWLPSSTVQTISEMLYLRTEELLFLVVIGLSVCATVFLLYIVNSATIILKNIMENSSKKGVLGIHLLIGLIMAVITIMLTQAMIEIKILSMGFLKFCTGCLLVYVIMMLLYCLLGKIRLSIVFSTVLFMSISTINVYIYSFRGRLFEPIDILSIGTAMNVADNYSLWPIPAPIIFGWIIWGGVLNILFDIIEIGREYIVSGKKRVLLTMCCFIGTAIVIVYALELPTSRWQKGSAVYNGYILDFVSKFRDTYIHEPEGYSENEIDKIVENYKQNSHDNDPPHIIVIMDESFSDLSVFADLTTNTEVTPFISSLKENVTSGYALASIYGGNTANSEYEFLTGNTMAWLSPNMVPYQQYLRSATYSMVSYLKTHYNYNCIAMHPYLANGWNRPSAYKNLGFDKSFLIDDFPQENMIRDYVSDKEMFDKIIEVYENQKEDRLFLFGVSMQNHGGYNYAGDNFKQSISLVGYENKYSWVEQYLSLIHETDKAVEYLLSYFSKVDEDVVIVFFGDHQPRIDEDFYEEIGAANVGSLDSQQKRYQIPFFIWTNFESQERQVECTSLNYLSTYVYECANIELPPYNQFLSDMENIIPAINANGFYSIESDGFLTFDEASDEERRWLKSYEMLQYNSIFDKENRNNKFFVTIKEQ